VNTTAGKAAVHDTSTSKARPTHGMDHPTSTGTDNNREEL